MQTIGCAIFCYIFFFIFDPEETTTDPPHSMLEEPTESRATEGKKVHLNYKKRCVRGPPLARSHLSIKSGFTSDKQKNTILLGGSLRFFVRDSVFCEDREKNIIFYDFQKLSIFILHLIHYLFFRCCC